MNLVFITLFLAGDWTNFGLNVGHLEGTCISGIRAAMAILKLYETADAEADPEYIYKKKALAK